ncbi:musculin-like [Oncorhynchus nerka]|uniref:musculin-like n=1 Tax=Oncorhynchus nerka TaxID=8023 RepID=UPI00113020E2|nr:musculin-like [Oncorhynchus nerka]
MSTGSVSDGEDIETCHQRTDAPFESYKTKRNVTQRRYTSTEYSDDAFVGTDGGYEVRTKRSYSTAVGGNQLFKGGRQMQRNAANARERARMRVLSKAFSRLKTSLPWVPADTKLSKLDTLRLASSYISHLRQLLQDNHFESSFVHPVNLTWPFVVGRSEDNKDMSAAGLCGVIS